MEKILSEMRKPGRPPDQSKRDAILEATHTLMMEHGANFTVDMVADRAGVSKQTLYNRFGGKEDLLLRVMQSILAELTTDLESFSETDNVRTALMAFGARYLRMVSDPQRTNFLRLIIGSINHADSSGQLFFRSGPHVLIERLAEFIAHQTELGHLLGGNPRLEAEQFIGLVLGTLQMRLLLGVEVSWTEEAIRDRVASAVDVFLASYGARHT